MKPFKYAGYNFELRNYIIGNRLYLVIKDIPENKKLLVSSKHLVDIDNIKISHWITLFNSMNKDEFYSLLNDTVYEYNTNSVRLPDPRPNSGIW